jgi:hypothetical protein
MREVGRVNIFCGQFFLVDEHMADSVEKTLNIEVLLVWMVTH